MVGRLIGNLISRDECEIRIAMLGPRRAGKTSMLTAMYERFENALLAEKVSDCISLTADRDTEEILTRNYEELERLIRSGGSVSEAIVGDAEAKEYRFYIKRSSKEEKVQVGLTFQDYPGGWLMAGAVDPDSEEYRRVLKYVKDSHVLLVAIDTPYLLECEGAFQERRNMAHLVAQTVKASWDEFDDTPRMVLLVPIKCEKYDTDAPSRKALVKAVRQSYAELLSFLDKMPRCAVICAPAQTTGCVKFERFDNVDAAGDLPSPVFTMPSELSERKYQPRDCSQALRFSLVYAIQQYVKAGSKGFLGGVRQFFKLDREFVEAAERLACGCKGTFFRAMDKGA